MQRVCWEVRQQGVGNPLAVIQKYQIFHNGPIFDFLGPGMRLIPEEDILVMSGSPQLLALDWSRSA